MPTQPDSVNIEQLRAQLDAIYAPAEETAEVVEAPAHPNAEPTMFVAPGVQELVHEAKSYSPDHTVEKAERIATIGQYIESLRMSKLGGR